MVGYVIDETSDAVLKLRLSDSASSENTYKFTTTDYADGTSVLQQFFVREDHETNPAIELGEFRAEYNVTNGSFLRWETEDGGDTYSMRLQRGYLSIGTATRTSRLTLVEGTTDVDGIAFGSDVTLYRSAANVLKTDDSLHISGSSLTFTGTGNTKIELPEGTTAADGIAFGTDVTLYRSAANMLKTDDNLHVAGDITTDGTVDGVDVADHRARHGNGGADEISLDWSQLTTGIATGTSSFAGNGTVSVPHGLGVVPSYVVITPCASAGGNLGEFHVGTKTSVYFQVTNTGSATTSFSWLAVV